jgi:arylsulfatase A-like enzyme
MSASKPNVLFLIMHDVGRRYGCYGNSEVISPNIDGLASESIRFEKHFCQWPLCGPSRANIFSGCRPLTTERYNNQPFFPGFRERRGEEFRSLPELFRRRGYRSFGSGLVYHDVDDPPSWSDGFFRPSLAEEDRRWIRIAQEASPNPWFNRDSLQLIEERLERLRARGLNEEELLRPDNLRKFRGPPVEAGDVGDQACFDGQAVEAALDWIDGYRDRGSNQPNQAPFFLAVGFTAGHLPFNCPRKYWELYEHSSLRLPTYRQPPEGSPEWAEGDSEPVQYYTQRGYEEPWHADEQQSLELLHGHYAAISYIDALIGRILKALGSRGLYENTLVVVTSDHGFHDGEHGYWGKHNLWDTSLSVPLLIRIPPGGGGAHRRSGGDHGDREGSVISALTEHVDLYPTLCDLCSLDKPSWLEGDSLLPLIDNPTRTWKRAVFAHRKHMWHDRLQVYDIAHTVRTERYRYTVYLSERGDPLYRELFDYQEDPLETENRAEFPGYAETVAELADMIESGWKRFRPDHR